MTNKHTFSLSFYLDETTSKDRFVDLMIEYESIIKAELRPDKCIITLSGDAPSLRMFVAMQLASLDLNRNGCSRYLHKIEFPEELCNKTLISCVDIISDFYGVVGVSDFLGGTHVYVTKQRRAE